MEEENDPANQTGSESPGEESGWCHFVKTKWEA